MDISASLLGFIQNATGNNVVITVILSVLLVILGFILLIKGADMFVDGASKVAQKLKVPLIVIGLTIVAFGTSAPEAAISITSACKNEAGIAVGNVIGSNIMNILVILGISALFAAFASSISAIFAAWASSISAIFAELLSSTSAIAAALASSASYKAA